MDHVFCILKNDWVRIKPYDIKGNICKKVGVRQMTWPLTIST